MKKYFLLTFLLLVLTVCNAQNDTSTTGNVYHRKRGFYKNYEEYTSNAPSMVPDFTITLLFIKIREDSVVSAATFQINDNSSLPAVWGFCDGTDVFITKRISTFKKGYFKAQCLGRIPFFYFWHKDIYAIGPPLFALATLAASAAAAPTRELMFIAPDGTAKLASSRNLRKLFAASPELLARFNSEKVLTDKIITDYLMEFDELYLAK